MAKLRDVNTTDIIDAIRLGCRTMSSIFDGDDHDIPYWRANARPNAFFGICQEDHVPGRHLNALLNAEDAAGIELDEDAIDKHKRAAFLSFSGPLALPMRRIDGKPIQFCPHHMREGLHALYALVKYRNSDRARQLAEACIDALFEYFDLATGWDRDRLEHEHGLIFKPMPVFIQGVGRAIGPLVKYYRATRYGPALELAIALKEKAIHEVFKEEGAYNPETFGTHVHSVTCVMSSLAQLADLMSDSVLMNLVKTFYDNGLWMVRDPIGWSIESGKPDNENVDEGETNNTGDILETALILGRWHRDGAPARQALARFDGGRQLSARRCDRFARVCRAFTDGEGLVGGDISRLARIALFGRNHGGHGQHHLGEGHSASGRNAHVGLLQSRSGLRCLVGRYLS